MNCIKIVFIILFLLSNIIVAEEKEHAHEKKKAQETSQKETPKPKPEWVLIKDMDRLKLSVREEPDSDIKMVKLTAFFAGTAKEVYEIVKDNESYPETFAPYFEKIEMVDKGSNCDYLYVLLSPPLIEKRETVIRKCFDYKKKHSFKMTWRNIDYKGREKNPDATQIVFTKGACVFAETKIKDEMKVTCEVTFDLGGIIPTFAMNKINEHAIPQVIWKIYHRVLKLRKDKEESKKPESK